MTRAKPKPTPPTREPAKKQRTENAAPAKSAPGKPVPVKTTTAKSSLVSELPRRAESAAKAAHALKAAPAKSAAKAAKAQPAGTSAPTAKAAVAKAAVAKAAPVAKATPAAKATPTAKATPAAKSALVIPAAPAGKAALALKAGRGKGAPAKSASSKAVSTKGAVPLDTPAKIRPIEQAVGVSSDAVARRTGKSWAEWFALLDAAGAAQLDHKGIVAVLAQRHGVGPWWQQMVTVAYEQARGKNGNTATDDGFQVDVSKVLELPLAKLFRFWAEPSERNKWLADDRFSIHKSTASKSIRASWGRGVSRIDVDFCEKGPSKSQVTVQHNRIETSDAAEQMKAYGAKKIRALEALTRS
ncbi:MAG TPA: hypothetical protein VGC79_01575 [Polyangiaceae bacterium]